MAHFVSLRSFFLPRNIFYRFFCALGYSRDPSGPQKTIKIVVLSSKFKVSLISKKFASGITFEAVWAHFWAHFGHFWLILATFGLLGALLDVSGRPHGRQKAAKDLKKVLQERLSRPPGGPRVPPGPPPRPKGSPGRCLGGKTYKKRCFFDNFYAERSNALFPPRG